MGWAGSPGRWRCRPAAATRSWSARPTGSARRPPSPQRSVATTRSGSTWWPCARTTSCARARRHCSSSTTSRSGGWTPSGWRSSSRGSRPAAAKPAVRSSAARPPSIPGSWRTTRSIWPGSAWASWSATGRSMDRRSGPATRSSGWPPRGCTPTGSHWSGRSSPSTGSTSTATTPASSGAVWVPRRPPWRWHGSRSRPAPRSARCSCGRPGSIPGSSSGCGPAWPAPATSCERSRTSPAAACPATCRVSCRPAWRLAWTRRAGHCRRSSACSVPSVGSTNGNCGPHSMVVSG